MRRYDHVVDVRKGNTKHNEIISRQNERNLINDNILCFSEYEFFGQAAESMQMI